MAAERQSNDAAGRGRRFSPAKLLIDSFARALTIGTWDGANIEIAEHVGLDHLFIFGHRTEEVAQLRGHGYAPRSYCETTFDPSNAIDRLAEGAFSPEEPDRYRRLTQVLLDSDYYQQLSD